jgi:hypothetical protein
MQGALDNAHALIAAAAGYPAVRPLPPIVLEDARCIYTALVDPQGGGYAPEHTRLLLDHQASQSGLRAGLAELARGCDADSTAFLFFSGHGARILKGPNSGEYLLPFDAQCDSPASLAQTAISTAELSAAIRAIPARKVVVVLDCCHSGGLGQPKTAAGAGEVVQPGLSEDAYERLRSGRGRAILASSRSDELSWTLPGMSNSLFTAHFLAGLQGGIASEDGLIHIFDLFEYIQPRVTAAQHNQHPIFKAELEDNFPVALCGGGQKAAVTLDPQGYRYDAYLAFPPGGPDAAFTWQKLAPFLTQQGLRVAVSGAVEEAGVALVVGVERAIQQSKRIVLVLSNAFLADEDNLVYYQSTLAASMGVLERRARILPLIIEPVDRARLPLWLSAIVPLDLSDPYAGQANWERLGKIIRGPVPGG